MIEMMFRYFVKFKTLPAFLLSVSILYGWAACTSLCEKVTEHHNHTNAFAEKKVYTENCLNPTDKEDGCPMTATVFVLQERQTVEFSASIVKLSSDSIIRQSVTSWSALLPETKQDSPPKYSSIPLFIRHLTFRI
jgi:hypothetical protein